MEITSITKDDCDLIQITGRIDSYTAPNLVEKLNNITIRNRHKLVLDLEDVNFVSSAGLRVLIDLQKSCRNSMGEVVLVNVPPRVYETLELAGFAPLFKFYNNANSAIEYFNS